MIMKRILILIIGLIGVAYGQYSPTSAKSRFVNGLALGTKLDSYFNAADSNAIYWRADSVVMAKYKGTARALAFAVSGGYLPISDTAAMLANRLKISDTLTMLANRLKISDTAFAFSNYRRTSTKITNSDLANSTISGISLGSNLASLTNGYGISGSAYNGSGALTWQVDTSTISTKANVTGALVGYTTVSRFTDSLTNVQSRIQTKQPLGAYITLADSSTILAGRWLPNRSADSIAVIRALANTKQPIGNYITFADSTTILAGRWLPNRSADSTAVLRALINTKGTGNGTVTSIATNTGTGITGGTITSTGTLAIDTATTISTKANVTGTLVGYTATGRFLDSLTNVQSRIQTKQPLGNYLTFADSSTILAGRWLPNRSADSIAVIRALANSKGTGSVTSVATGVGLSGGTITTSGTISADTTTLATRAYAAGLDVAKANTSLNNVNGVLSSTYGGAGSVSGILKANGSGVVSAAVNNSDFTLLNGTGFVRMSGTTPSYLTGASSQFVKADGSLDGNTYATTGALSGYLPLTAGSGNTITGTLYINSSLLNSSSTYLDIYNNTTDGSDTKITRIGGGGDVSNNRGANIDLRGNEAIGAGNLYLNAGGSGAIIANAALSGPSLSMSGEGLFGGAITDGTNKLKVAGSGLFSSSVTASGFSTTSTSGISINSGDGVIDWSSGLRFRVYILGTGYVTPLTLNNTTGAATFSSSVTASSLIKSGGTSSQFLKADGSVDGNTYATTAQNALKVNISDTASMLSNRLRISDTATMLLPFVQYSDTATQMNGYLRKNFALLLQDTATAFNPYLRKSDTATMLTMYLRKTDTTSMLLPYLRKTDTISMLSPYYRTATATAALATKLNISDTLTMLSNYARKSGTAFTGGVNGTSLLMSGSVTANTLIVNSNTTNVGTINTSNSTGGFINWQTNGTTIADIGTATQVFGSGGSEVFAINGRGARAIALGTNGVNRLNIASTGEVSLSSSISSTRGVFNNSTQSQLEIFGWNNIQGASTNAGEIRFGGTTSIQGRLIYSSAGNSTLYLDNTFDNANAEIKLRTRVSGTAVDALTLTSTAATFPSTMKSSGLIQPISLKTANYTLTTNDHTVIFNTASGNLTATLPAGVEGQIYILRKSAYGVSTNNLIITPNGSQTIEGASGYTIDACSGEGITIQFLGGNWYIINRLFLPNPC